MCRVRFAVFTLAIFVMIVAEPVGAAVFYVYGNLLKAVETVDLMKDESGVYVRGVRIFPTLRRGGNRAEDDIQDPNIMRKVEVSQELHRIVRELRGKGVEQQQILREMAEYLDTLSIVDSYQVVEGGASLLIGLVGDN